MSSSAARGIGRPPRAEHSRQPHSSPSCLQPTLPLPETRGLPKAPLVSAPQRNLRMACTAPRAQPAKDVQQRLTLLQLQSTAMEMALLDGDRARGAMEAGRETTTSVGMTPGRSGLVSRTGMMPGMAVRTMTGQGR